MAISQLSVGDIRATVVSKLYRKWIQGGGNNQVVMFVGVQSTARKIWSTTIQDYVLSLSSTSTK